MRIKRKILLTGLMCKMCIDAHPINPSDSISKDSILCKALMEVTVTAEHPRAKTRADKLSYYPSAMISGGQGNVYEAIKALPGVTMRANGELNINVTQSLSINIDGRKTILNGDNLISYLKSLPVADIERIEILSSDGAKGDGTDSATILNLVKRQKKEDSYSIGMNMDGQLWKAKQIYGAAFGEYIRGGHSLSLNYSRYAAHNPSELFTDRPYLDSQERLTQSYDRKRDDSSHFLSASYEYRPLNRLIIGTSFNYNRFRRKEPAVMTTNVPSVPEPTVTSNNALFVTDNFFGEIYVRRRSEEKGSEWTAACDIFRFKSSESQLMEDNTGKTIYGDMTGKTYGAVGSFDFAKPVSSHCMVSAGARVSYINMNSQGSYIGSSSMIPERNSSAIDDLGSGFRYDENVNAIYTEGKWNQGILNATIGLRGEQSNLNIRFSGNESAEFRSVSQRYFQLYPSVSIMISKQEFGSWMLIYSNKVTRPGFSDLDPFIHIFDDITHIGGNINLKEAHRHTMNLIWSDNRYWRIMSGAEYISDDIVKFYRELSDRIVYVTPENIPSHLQLTLSATVNNLRITSWWTVSANANLIYSNYRFAKDTGLEPNNQWTPMFDIKNALNLPCQITAEINASFRGRLAYGQARTSSVWNTYLGLRKDLYGGRVSVSVYIKDIFNSNHFNS
ncbi:MAG: outer membrane beta-barrel protein, partial [Muribaculaceae bacterium]|nr:outer membrane beta-barrel protein [Muribaculaceae bacterium]